MKELLKHIKDKKYKKIYLFYGEEKYLINSYSEKIKNALIPKDSESFNLSVLEGKNADYEKIVSNCKTMPFMSDKKVVVVKYSDIFTTSKKISNTENIAEYFNNIPDFTTLIFIDENVDKRSKTYKSLAKNGYAVEFKTPSEGELATWVRGVFKKKNIEIEPSTAIYFVRSVGNSMENLMNEISKLESYKNYEGTIIKQDIEHISTKSLETKIFTLVDAIGYKNTDSALKIFANLILLKEHPLTILALISRQFRIILKSRLFQEKGDSTAIIADKLKQRSFVISNCIKQGSNFTMDEIKNIIIELNSTDYNIKTGKISAERAVEKLILWCCN